MQSRVDREFREQAHRFAFRFTCESCIHYEADCQRCSNGYPTVAHSRLNLDSLRWLAFCKTFELY